MQACGMVPLMAKLALEHVAGFRLPTEAIDHGGTGHQAVLKLFVSLHLLQVFVSELNCHFQFCLFHFVDLVHLLQAVAMQLGQWVRVDG